MKDILTMALETGCVLEPTGYAYVIHCSEGSLQRFADLIRADAVPPGYVVVPVEPIAYRNMSKNTPPSA